MGGKGCFLLVVALHLLRHFSGANVDECVDNWHLVFRQTAPTVMTEEEAKNLNSGDNTNNNYSILDQLESFRFEDDKLTLRLFWPCSTLQFDSGQRKNYQIWRQRSNPVTAIESVVVDYESIFTPFHENLWGGLEKNDGNQALLDGSSLDGNQAYWYAVGVTEAGLVGQKLPGPAGNAELQVELYALKPESTSASPAVCPPSSPPPVPTVCPSAAPTKAPTEAPTKAPTEAPTESPTTSPTESPTTSPTERPTGSPTESPTDPPTEKSTESPTVMPSASPTPGPTASPSESPTPSPTTNPAVSPTETPTVQATSSPMTSLVNCTEDNNEGWGICQLPSFKGQVCVQQRLATECVDSGGEIRPTAVQSRSCFGENVCRVPGLRVTLQKNASSADFETMLHNASATVDVSQDLRFQYEWNVSKGESIFADLVDVKAAYILRYEGSLHFTTPGFYTFSLESNDVARLRLSVEGGIVAEVHGGGIRRLTTSASFEVGTDSTLFDVEILTYRGEEAHYFRVQTAFEDEDLKPLHEAENFLLDFEFMNTDDVCQQSGEACSEHGLCFEGSCTCDFDYYGMNCELSCKCENGGQCHDGMCICGGGWSGPTCETRNMGNELLTSAAVGIVVLCVGVIALLCLASMYGWTHFSCHSAFMGGQPHAKIDSGVIKFGMRQQLSAGTFRARRALIPLDKLKNLQIIGAGGQAQIYRGQYGKDNVAVKKYFIAENDEGLQQAWAREADLLKKMRHPNIIQFFGLCMSCPHFYIVMELASFSMQDLISPGDIVQDEIFDLAWWAGGPPGSALNPSSDTLQDGKLEGDVCSSDGEAICGEDSGRHEKHSSLTFFRNPFSGPSKKRGMPEITEDDSALAIELPHFDGEKISETCKKSWRGLRQQWQSVHQKNNDALGEDMARQLLEAILFMHSRDIIHRDVKPGNILFVERTKQEWRLKLADFGMSRFCIPGDGNALTALIGSPQYTAPEILKGEQHYRASVDMYSFGMVMWALIHEQDPMAGAGVYSIIDQVANQGARPKIPEDCPAALATLITDCWQPDATKRPTAKDALSRCKWATTTGSGTSLAGSPIWE